MKTTIEKALKGHRTEALTLWKMVADGAITPDVQGWLQQVARRIVQADGMTGDKHPGDRIKRAVGLTGVHDRTREFREFVKDWDARTLLTPPARGEGMAETIEALRLWGLVEDDASDIEVRKRVDRARRA